MFSKPGNQSQYQQVIMFDGISISHCETANSGEELRRTFEDNQPSFNLKLQESIQDCSNEVWDFRNSFMEISHLTNMGVGELFELSILNIVYSIAARWQDMSKANVGLTSCLPKNLSIFEEFHYITIYLLLFTLPRFNPETKWLHLLIRPRVQLYIW